MPKSFASYMTYDLIKLDRSSRLEDALNFFIYETIKIFLLFALIIFIVSIIRSYFPPESIKRILSHKHEFIGNILASLLGVVTPFCSCSAVQLFIGFVEAGVPLGVTFSLLISSPMVNRDCPCLYDGGDCSVSSRDDNSEKGIKNPFAGIFL